MFLAYRNKHHLSFKYQAIVFLKWFLYALLIGLGVGVLCAIFMHALLIVTDYRTHHTEIIWGLPFAGLIIGLIYQYWGQGLEAGNALLMEKSMKYTGVLPLKMVPLILMTSVATHLFGGSSGREGAAVQMGGVWAHQLIKPFGVHTSHSSLLIITGVSAGFGAMFGTPLAAFIFAMEVFTPRKFLRLSLMPTLVAGYVGYFIGKQFQLPYEGYKVHSPIQYDWDTIIAVIVIGLISGLLARLLVFVMHAIGKTFKLVPYAPLRPFLGGFILIGFYYLIGNFDYAGLGDELMNDAFTHPQPALSAIYKMMATIITLGTGFKGGEVTTMFFMGSMVGNVVSQYMNIAMDIAVGIGFISVFAGASKAPLACTMVVYEIFGPQLVPFALIAAISSYIITGPSGIYNLTPKSPVEHPFIMHLYKKYRHILWMRK